MPDDITPDLTETVTAEAEVSTSTEGTAEVTETPAEAAARMLDLNEFGDYVVTAKVDGEEVVVPVAEAIAGYQRTQDYTRKTQEVAAARAQLQAEAQAHAEAMAIAEALATDPEGTIKVLQEWYAADTTQNDADLDDLDPLEREIKEVRGWIDAREQEAADAAAAAALEADLTSMQERYGIDPGELLQFAVVNEIPNLEWAYAVMQQSREAATTQVHQEQEQAEAARAADKQEAVVVEGGAGLASGASTVPVGTKETVRTAADAFALAKRQLGFA